MNEEYIVIPLDEQKTIAFPIVENDFLDGSPLAVKYNYVVSAYKFAIREDMFVDNLVMFDIIFYLGTRYFPRKTIGNKFSSATLSVQFTTQVKDKNVLEDKIWEYIYSVGRMNAEQLKKLDYRTHINNDLQSSEEKDVIKIFNTVSYLPNN